MILTMTYKYINFEYLDTMTGGDAEMKHEMLKMLIAEIPQEVDLMEKAAAASDWEEVFQVSHKFKTTLSFIGSEELIAINKTVEQCSRLLIDVEEIPPMVAQIAEKTPLVMKELTTAFNG